MPIVLLLGGSTLAVTALAALYARYKTAEATAAEIEADGGRWVKSVDGRRFIEYFVCGDVSSSKVVYFQHGYGQTGKLVFKLSDMAMTARKLGLKIISPSQPGFGLSSPYPVGQLRKLREWPSDVAQILEQEGVGDFYVAGISAGGVHALTIAQAFGKRVLGVGLATPTAPLSVEEAIAKMPLITRFIRKSMTKPFFGDLLGLILSYMPSRSRMETAPDVAAALTKMDANEPVVEWHAANFEGFLEDQDRGVVKGHRGWSDNMVVLNEDLPFPVEELAAITAAGKAIVISSAPDDTTNPPLMQQWWLQNIKGAQIIQCAPGYGHLHFCDPACFERIFQGMMGKKLN